MSYTLRAFIGKVDIIKPLATQLTGVRVVELPHNFALIPLTDESADFFEVDGFVESFWLLPTTLFNLAMRLSATDQIGYFEIDMFGGTGDRNAVLWHNQQVAFGPITSQTTSATEQLFTLLGVPTGKAHDKFDALNLGRYRHLEDWLDN